MLPKEDGGPLILYDAEDGKLGPVHDADGNPIGSGDRPILGVARLANPADKYALAAHPSANAGRLRVPEPELEFLLGLKGGGGERSFEAGCSFPPGPSRAHEHPSATPPHTTRVQLPAPDKEGGFIRGGLNVLCASWCLHLSLSVSLSPCLPVSLSLCLSVSRSLVLTLLPPRHNFVLFLAPIITVSRYLMTWTRVENNPVVFEGSPGAFPGQVWKNDDHWSVPRAQSLLFTCLHRSCADDGRHGRVCACEQSMGGWECCGAEGQGACCPRPPCISCI